MKIRALIVDDEAPARSEMRYLLEKIREVEILGEAGGADEALKLIESVHYDVAFIDIDMPVMNGLDMAKKINDVGDGPAIVFFTAYNQFAVKAFDLEAADYLVKPVSEDRLNSTIQRVLKKLGRSDIGLKNGLGRRSERERFDRIPVTEQSKTILLSPEEIFFVESRGETTLINSEKGEFVSTLRLKDFEARLSPRYFFRSHRSFVVNLNHVGEMTALYGGLYVLKIKNKLESEVPVSRRQSKYLKTLLGMR